MKILDKLQTLTSIIAEQTNISYIPPHIIDAIHKMDKVENELKISLNREPTYEEIANKMGDSFNEFHVKEMKRILKEYNHLIYEDKGSR